MRNFTNFIDRLTPDRLADAFRAIINSRKESNELRTRDEVLQEVNRLQRLAADVTSFKPTFRRRQIPKTITKIRSAEHFNDPMEEALIDVNVLYDYANQFDKMLRSHKRIYRADMERVTAGIKQLAAAVNGYLETINDTNYTKVVYVGFSEPTNRAEPTKAASVNVDTNDLTLPVTKRRRMHELRGASPTTVETNSLTSVGQVASFVSFKPKLAIDADPNTFWAAVYMTDGPVETVYDSAAYPGVLTELIVTLPYIDSINEIKFVPFGPFPISVIDVCVWTDEDGWTQFDGFVQHDASFDAFRWAGLPQWAKKVKFVVQQETYKAVDYLLPKSLVDKQNLWTQILESGTRLVLEDSELQDRQKLAAGFDSSYNIYLEGLRRLTENLEDVDIEEVLGEESNKTKRFVDVAAQTMAPGEDKPRHLVVRHLTGEDSAYTPEETVRMEAMEYVLGAYHVEINHTEYAREAEYASKKFRAPGTVERVVFDTTETHQEDELGWRPTSVEYEVEFAEGRSVNVAPASSNHAVDEFMFIHPRSLQGVTRFEAGTTPNLTLRANGKVVDTSVYVTDPVSGTDNRQVVTISEDEYSIHTKYTVTYTLDASNHPSDISLEDYARSTRINEEFGGTDASGAVRLTYHPYIVYSIVNDDTNFDKESDGSAVWHYVSATPMVYDGHYYSQLNSMLAAALTETANQVQLSNTTGLAAAPGVVLIEDEEIQYTNVAGNNLTLCSRGTNNTLAAPHPIDTPVIGERIYEPVKVWVNEVKAKNITAYDTSKHPAFSPGGPDTMRPEFVQIENMLYFNVPVVDASIKVEYATLAQYVQIKATLRSNTVQRPLCTPVVDDFVVKMKHTVL